MAKSRASKTESLDRLRQRLSTARGVVFADVTGLVMKELEDLRAEFRKAGVTYEVVKKSILERAFRDAGLSEAPQGSLTGSLSVGISPEDEVVPARVAAAFAKTHDKLKLLGGVLEQRFVDATTVQAVASLPAKPDLQARLVGTLAGPMRGLVSVLQGNLRGLVQVLKARTDSLAVEQ